VTVLEGADAVLPGFPAQLAQRAQERLAQQGVEIHLGQIVKAVDEDAVITSAGTRFPSSTVIWAAGVQPGPVIDTLQGERARDGRLIVRPTLQVNGDERTFLIGDMAALIPPGESRPLAALAPVALQEGAAAAKNLLRAMSGRPMRPFKYQDRGSLVILGRYGAVAQVGSAMFDGLPAWLLWRAVHLVWLRGIRHKLEVLVDWSLLTMTPRQTSIIEGGQHPVAAAGMEAKQAVGGGSS